MSVQRLDSKPRCLPVRAMSNASRTIRNLGVITILVFLFLECPSALGGIITVELTPATSGAAPGRDRPGSPLLHLDFSTSPSFSSGGFLVDSITANPLGPSFTFATDVEGWFNEPEEAILVSFESSGIEGGSMRIEPSGFRDAFELEHDFDPAWNAQQAFYSSITLKVLFDDPAINLSGVDFIIDDGTQSALYSTAGSSVAAIPEPSSLALWAVGASFVCMYICIRRGKERRMKPA